MSLRPTAGLLAVLLLAACQSSHAPRRVVDARPAPMAEARETAVRELLTARATAVRRHDRGAFLATVDPLAAAFRAAQASLFAGLTQLPLATFDYQLDPTDERTGARRTGTWWAPAVTEVYRLAGFDPTPVRERQQPTFVEHDGRWWLTADDDFPAARTTRGLWDDGPIVLARGAACLVVGHPTQARLVRSLAGDCDAAVPRVTAVWGTWTRRVVVLVPNDPAELARLVPGSGDLHQIAAVATAELDGQASSGDRVLVNPPVFRKLGSLGRRVVMTHEVTHVASRPATGTQTPTWLVEGLADFVGYRGAGVPVPVAARELQQAIRAGRVPRALPTDGDFDGSRADLSATYEQAWLAVTLLADRYGVPALLRLYRAVGRDGGLGPQLAALGTTLPAFTAAWRADLLRRLR